MIGAHPHVDLRLSQFRGGRDEKLQRTPFLREVFSDQIQPVPRADLVMKESDILIIIGKGANMQKTRCI